MEPLHQGFSLSFGITLIISAVATFISLRPYSLPQAPWVIDESCSLQTITKDVLLGHDPPPIDNLETSDVGLRMERGWMFAAKNILRNSQEKQPIAEGLKEPMNTPQSPDAPQLLQNKVLVGLNFSLIPFTGWGNLAYALFTGTIDDNSSSLHPILLQDPHPSAFLASAPHSQRMHSLLTEQRSTKTSLLSSTNTAVPVLHAVDHVFFDESKLRGRPNVGFIFFERLQASVSLMSQAASRFDCFIVGSEWNARMLRLRGLPSSTPVHTIIQGVDTNIFTPARCAQARSRPQRLSERFVIFSGGKFELRKAQDIVVAAFRAFRSKYPEAKPMLVFSWNNPWPIQWYSSLGGGSHTQGVPAEQSGGGHDFMTWLAANGVPPEDAHDLGVLGAEDMAEALTWADVALFPNRCEGGTNLVAMEAMASGVPTILSNNTGHLDLTRVGCSPDQPAAKWACVPLTIQRRLVPDLAAHASYNPYEGWGESDVDECVEKLGALWQLRAKYTRIGRKGAALISSSLTWKHYRAKLALALEQCMQQ